MMSKHMAQELMGQWLNPPAVFRGKPFWSWNGKLEKSELLRQLGLFKDMGMGGVFFHSRTGLATEYLGTEWMELTKACADEAARLGLEAWLYDEDRWPSGSAGGLATKETRHRMKYLRLTVYRGDDEPLWPSEDYLVAAFAADLDGLDLGRYERWEEGAGIPAGRALLIFSWEYMAPHSFYNNEAYLDTLSREATEHFLSLTHDRYAKACGGRIGGSIRGIFTDEPHHGFVFCDIHGQPGPANTAWITPWTSKLPAEFQAVFGYDLRERLPELFLRVPDRLSPVKWAYMETIQRLFLENWARPLQDRCHRLGLLLTGHVLHEDSLAAQAIPCGSVMRYYEYLDQPGVDVLGVDNRNFWIVKQLASVARQTGKKWLLSELYGCSGWAMGLDGHKRIGDWQALLGINVRCHHLSWYSMAGESKRDYPASIFFQSAWYRDYDVVETYFSRLHVLLQQGRPACDVLVLSPIESLWAQVYAGWATWLSAKDADVARIEGCYRNLFGWLTSAQIDFDYGDEAMLSRLGSVEPDGTHLRLGEMAYRSVVVCGMETMRQSTLDLLLQFAAAGGNLVFCGPPPSHLDARPSDEPGALARSAASVPMERSGIVAAILAGGGEPASWQVSSSDPAMLSQVRIDGKNRLAVLLNTDAWRDLGPVTCRARTSGGVAEYDCLSGEILAVPSRHEEGWLVWETTLPPLKERAFRFGPGIEEDWPVQVANPVATVDRIEGPLPYELDEPNLCVLDFAAWKVADTPWQPRAEVLAIEKSLAAQLGFAMRSGQMVQPWAAATTPDERTVPLSLQFMFTIEDLPTAAIDLIIEQPEKWCVSLNGHAVGIPAITAWHIDPCFRRIPLPLAALKTGENTIVMACDYGQGVDLEAIYLAGNFGVWLDGTRAKLTKLPKKLSVGDIAAQGLPFYSGRVTYRAPWDGQPGRIELPPPGAAAVVFRGADGDILRRVPWAPFVCDIPPGHDQVFIELALSRRNTFGPLHWTPPPPDPGTFGGWTGPECFRTEGEEWSDPYQLVAQGLMGPLTCWRAKSPRGEADTFHRNLSPAAV